MLFFFSGSVGVCEADCNFISEMIHVEKPFLFLILISDSSVDIALNNSPTQVVAQHKEEEKQLAKGKGHQKTL